MLPINIIRGTHPRWVQVISYNKSEGLVCLVNPLLPGDLSGKDYKLSIRRQGKALEVSEDIPGTGLPHACPTRHINKDGTFCIGLDAGQNIETVEDANHWWNSLGHFLQVQQFSEKRGYWPSHLGLSHGEAARHQLKLEALADSLGWKKEVLESIQYSKGWLSGKLPEIGRDQKLANEWLSCPRGCQEAGKPIQIRQCLYRQEVTAMVNHELQRRKSEREYLQGLLSSGFRCCQSLPRCPLK